MEALPAQKEEDREPEFTERDVEKDLINSTPQDVDVLKEINGVIDAVKQFMNRNPKGVKSDFRDRAQNIEWRKVILPRLRPEEIWDFFQPKKMARYNTSIAGKAFGSLIAGTLLFSLVSGGSNMFFFLPYVVLGYAYLLPYFGFKNMQKWLKFSLGASAITLVQIFVHPYLGIGIAQMSMLISPVVAAIISALPALSFMLRLNDVDKYVENQKGLLKEMRETLIKFRDVTEVREVNNGNAIKDGKDEDGSDKFVKVKIMKKIGELTRPRRIFADIMRPGEAPIDEPLEEGQPEVVVHTEALQKIINDAIDEIDGLLGKDITKTEGAGAEKKRESDREKVAKELTKKEFNENIKSLLLSKSVLGGLALILTLNGVIFTLGGALVPGIIILFANVVVISMSAIWFLYKYAEIKREAYSAQRIFIDTAKDMRAVFQEKDLMVYNAGKGISDRTSLRTLDVWRFLVELREAVRIKTIISRKIGGYQAALDSKVNGFMNNRDTGINRGPLDSRHLEKITEGTGMLWHPIMLRCQGYRFWRVRGFTLWPGGV
ncbi:MAG: hypothetical protein HQL28_02975 [Candidatus Omnitrophica bacterium]|nr:hypothetical protein [Candidatus Omnitrophota bacterium]